MRRREMVKGLRKQVVRCVCVYTRTGWAGWVSHEAAVASGACAFSLQLRGPVRPYVAVYTYTHSLTCALTQTTQTLVASGSGGGGGGGSGSSAGGGGGGGASEGRDSGGGLGPRTMAQQRKDILSGK